MGFNTVTSESVTIISRDVFAHDLDIELNKHNLLRPEIIT